MGELQDMTVSIIIPVYNEAENISNLINYLTVNSDDSLLEIIVVDGGSMDGTLAMAKIAGVNAVLSPDKGRAAQMNYGTSLAKGNVLYFVHADTLPPKTFLTDIINAVNKGFDMGRYRSRYDSKSWLLKINALLSRLDTFAGMGGDQSLFITKKLLGQTGGFNSSMQIMEEFDFCARARKFSRYTIISKAILISARKYDTNGWLRVQKANHTIFKMYRQGASQQSMVSRYKELLNYR